MSTLIHDYNTLYSSMGAYGTPAARRAATLHVLSADREIPLTMGDLRCELVKELDRLQQKRKTAQETISIIDEEIKELRRYSGTFDD
jgi:cell division FtsZ-interacting protein ZapD